VKRSAVHVYWTVVLSNLLCNFIALAESPHVVIAVDENAESVMVAKGDEGVHICRLL